MIRGTTPTVTYTLPFDVTNAEKIWVTFSQKRREIFTLKKEDLEITENVIKGKLTQKQTLALADNSLVEMQVRILFPDEKIDDALASTIMTTYVDRILKEGEI